MRRIYFLLLLSFASFSTQGQGPRHFTVIAYYSGGLEKLNTIPAEKITHIIFSFCHLQGNKLTVDSQKDSATIQQLVLLKKVNPKLKVILSLGGWGGCEKCSPVFATAAGRKEFAHSVLALQEYFHTDGIDLDWEYPAIEGYPAHQYLKEDRVNFTALIKDLRATMGKKSEISFAAGGFQKYLEESIDWKNVIPLVDRVNLMTYDLINGYSTETGHHTALYSRAEQKESTDNAVQYLVKIGVPRNKLVIGAAFYGRIWENVPDVNNGLYQSGKFKSFVDYSQFSGEITPESGYNIFWDEQAQAPYAYNADKKLFITYDDKRSIKIKTQYVIDQKLDGIMFWEMTCDSKADGLLDVIDEIRTAKK
jgi:chitinase